jgi:hypothetical protein
MGFRNQGQFIAALHVAHNLGCDCFQQLKTDMTTNGMSLGRAIQDVKKTANPTVEAKRAEAEADDDIKRADRTETESPDAKNKKRTTQRIGDDR